MFMNSHYLPPASRPIEEISVALLALSERFARAAARSATGLFRKKRGATLRPGPATPMWNSLVASVRPHLRPRGCKINLGRELGVPPQRIHEYFVARTATPDAERTLMILHWLVRQQPVSSRHRQARNRTT